MSSPRVIAVAPGSPAARAGVAVGDEVVTVDGEAPRDIIRWTWLTDEPDPVLVLHRGGLELEVEVAKGAGEPLGIEVHSALFDQLRTCDNHCEFCFIYQLPPGLRKSLYLKDDDYRLSFLYGNFTTLTRFTEADLERVVTEGLSPLNVSIHATDPAVRNDLLRNRRGGPSLRWLRALLDHGIEVHGQIVCCPGLNDGAVLDDTLAGVLDRFPELASLCVVPLGISRYNTEARMRATTASEAAAVIDCVEDWQEVYRTVLGRRLVHAADEYYLLAGRPFPGAEAYEGFAMHEDGVGMARTFELEFHGDRTTATGPQAGFFAWADGAAGRAPLAASVPPSPAGHATRYEAAGDFGAPAEGYRAVRSVATLEPPAPTRVSLTPRSGAPVAVLTGTAGAQVIAPLVAEVGRDDVRVVAVENRFFGGTTSVTGLLVGEDLARVLATEPEGHRYLLPDVCLSGDRFLDGTSVADLPRPVEILATDGAALRRALEPTP
jgi:putative radical SAM enzyme (TIGR03279 family)